MNMRNPPDSFEQGDSSYHFKTECLVFLMLRSRQEMLFTRQQRIQQHGHNERHSDAVGCEDGLEQWREVDENVTDLRETDADGETQRCNGDVALRVAGL